MVYCDSASMTRFIYVRDGQVSGLVCSYSNNNLIGRTTCSWYTVISALIFGPGALLFIVR